jgi:LPS-assembly protein
MAIAALLLLAGKASAQKKIQLPAGQAPVSASADQLSYDREQEVLTLSGNVKIVRNPWVIYAAELEVLLKTNLVRAKNGVRIVKLDAGIEKEVLSADQAEINIDTQTGFLVSGKLMLPMQEGRVTITGERLERVSEDKYLFKTGSFTTCQCEAGKIPDWQISAQEISADTQNSVKIKSAKILIHDQAVFFLPYYEYPISTKRKSGFLVPQLGYSSRSGLELGFPYYQTLGPSADLTLYPTWYEKRGVMLGAETRYDLGKFSVGRLEGYVIDDHKDDSWRWSGAYQGDSTWNTGFLREDIGLLSDNEYILDFDQDIARRWERQHDSTVAFSQDLPGSNLNSEINWFNDLTGSDLRTTPGQGPDIDKTLIQIVPEVNYQVFNRKIIGPVGFDLLSTFSYLYRQDRSLGRGASLDFAPRVTYTPYFGPGLKIFTAAGYTLSGVIPDQNMSQRYGLSRPFAEADVSLSLEKIFEPGPGAQTKYRHLLEPELVVNYLGASNTPKDPLFEQVYEPDQAGLIGIRLTSLLFQKAIGQKNAATNLVSEFELNQFYDYINNDFYDLELKGFFRVPDRMGVNTDIYLDPDGVRLSRGQVAAWMQDSRKDRFWLGFLYTKGQVNSYWYQFLQEDDEDWSAGASVPIYRDLAAAYQIDYSQKYGTIVGQNLVFSFTRQKCWRADLKLSEGINPETPGKDPVYSANFYFQILGIAKLNTIPEYAGLGMAPAPGELSD